RLVDPWNPYIAQLVLAVAIIACWAVFLGHTVWLPWLIGAGSLATQAHIAFLPPVACLVVVAIAGLIWSKTRPSKTQLFATAAVVAIAWTPPLIDLFLPGHHNLFHVAHSLIASPPASSQGFGGALRIVLRETGLSADWLGGRAPLATFTQAFDGKLGIAPGIGLVAAGWTGVHAVRRHDRVAGALTIILAALTITAIVEMSSNTGPAYPYLFGWVSLIGMLAIISPILTWTSISPILTWTPSADRKWLMRSVARTACVTAALLTVIVACDAVPPRSPLEQSSDADRVKRTVDIAAAALDPHQRYQLIHGADVYNSIYELGVVSELQRRHITVVVEPNAHVLFGRQMSDPSAASYPAIEIVAPYLGPVPGFTPLVVSDPLTGAQRQRERQLTEQLTTTYLKDGNADAAALINSTDSDIVGLAAFAAPTDSGTAVSLQELTTLRRKGRPFAIILTDVETTGGS
ncbi:MAG: hypothetical protein ABIQ39_01415, partial [Ilumatobacteraceae bacterium]